MVATMKQASPPRMKRREALETMQAIRKSIREARLLLLELYERDGWRVLGYSSWRECCSIEFGLSVRRLYELLQVAQVERDLRNSAQLDSNETPPAQQLLELARIDGEALRAEIWAEATRDGDTTAEEIAELVSIRQGQLVEDDDAGDLAPEEFVRESRGGHPSPTTSADPVGWILRRLAPVKDRHAALGERAAEADRRLDRYLEWVEGA